MTRILSGTAAVLNGARIVAFTGAPLSDANCPADGNVVLGGAAYFIAGRTDTASFELTRDYEGADGTVSCEIDPLNAAAINLARVARSITDYDAKLALLDANGKGLFYNLIGVTGAGDPGPGNVAFDNADMAQVSALFLDVLDANASGLDVSGLIDLWSPGTVLIVRSLASSAYAAFQITQAPVDAGGFRRVAVEPVGSDGVLAAELVAVEWRLAGAAKDVDDYAPDVAGLDAFAAEADGFIVLVADVGDGRAARYRRDVGVPGGWLLVGYWTGAKGDKGDTGDQGPTGRGPRAVGGYDAGTAYVLDDAVLDNGSTWIALGPTIGNAPPVLPTTSNAWWQLLARKGTDGTGTGTVVGPASAVDERVAVFDGTTGELLKDGGKTVADIIARENHTGEQAIETVTDLQAALDAKKHPNRHDPHNVIWNSGRLHRNSSWGQKSYR
ncbi:MAG TPA: hypothetical protein VL147_18515 [Devosia sp.]|nr:hypothetical protein [Devosia sp.]